MRQVKFDLLSLPNSLTDIYEYLGEPTDSICGCGQEYLKRFEARNGRCEKCRIKDVGGEDSCGNPECRFGWHFTEDNGHLLAVERCPELAEREATKKWDGTAYRGGKTFNTFDRSRELSAFDAAQKWANSATGQETLALLRSKNVGKNTGCGKSHLLSAAGREMAKRGLWVEMISSKALTDMMRGRATYSERPEYEAKLKRWIAADVLILDDLGNEESAGPVTGSFLMSVYDERGPKPLAFASNLSADEIRNRYGEPMFSRWIQGSSMPPMMGRDYRGR